MIRRSEGFTDALAPTNRSCSVSCFRAITGHKINLQELQVKQKMQ